MEYQDVLQDVHQDEFGRTAGMALFPCFQREIEIFCDSGVSPEYVQKSLEWLREVDGKLMEKICKYASYYLQDELENTSVGELMDEGAQHLESPMDVLNYMEFSFLNIEMPENPNLPVLNLGGGCDWREEGLQCLIVDWKVVYLGSWNDYSVWWTHYLDDDQYLSNYVLYERRAELQAKVAERLKQEPPEPFPHLEIPMNAPIRKFVEFDLALMEKCTSKEAWTKIENMLLFEFMKDYPKLLEESFDFLYCCYCIERDRGPGDMAQHLAENTDIF